MIISEEEKSRIKQLHNIEVIKEQYPKNVDEILEALLDGSQRLQRYIKDARIYRGVERWRGPLNKKNLQDIEELICGNLEQLLRE